MSAKEQKDKIASVLAGVGYAGLWAEEIMSALSKAGYRILAPGEVDAETLDRCVKELNKLPWFEDVVSLVDVEETLRSLAQGSKDKEARE